MKIIDEKMSSVLLNNGFSKTINSENDILFIKESEGYKISFSGEKKRFDLFECGIDSDGSEEIGKSISAWLFDPENDTEKEAKEIAQDFANTVSGTNTKSVKSNPGL